MTYLSPIDNLNREADLELLKNKPPVVLSELAKEKLDQAQSKAIPVGVACLAFIASLIAIPIAAIVLRYKGVLRKNLKYLGISSLVFPVSVGVFFRSGMQAEALEQEAKDDICAHFAKYNLSATDDLQPIALKLKAEYTKRPFVTRPKDMRTLILSPR